MGQDTTETQRALDLAMKELNRLETALDLNASKLGGAMQAWGNAGKWGNRKEGPTEPSPCEQAIDGAREIL